MFSGISRAGARLMSTSTKLQSAAQPAYPFSKSAIIRPPPPVQPPATMQKGTGLMEHIKKSLFTNAQKAEMMQKLLSRKSPEQLRVGSIVSVISDQAPNTFNGVLIAIRRRGPDSSIRVRNILQRTGTELQFFLNSPLLKDVKVLRPPPKRYMRRAKLFYLRDSTDKMSMLAGGKH